MQRTSSRYDGHADWYDDWNKPNAERNAPDVLELLGSGDGLCLDLGWHREAPWWGPYIRKRVGMRQHPLAELLNAFISAGLMIEHVAEPGERAIPTSLAIRARKPPVST